MSRQKKQSTIQEISYTTCPYCNGSGVRPSLEYTALSAFRKIESQAVKGQAADIRIALPHEVAGYLLNQKRMELCRLESDYNLPIYITGSGDMNWDEVSITVTKRETSLETVTAPEAAETKTTGKTQKRQDKKTKQHPAPPAPVAPAPDAATAPPAGEELAPSGTEAPETAELPLEPPKKKPRRRTRRRKKKNVDLSGVEAPPTDVKIDSEAPSVSLGQGVTSRGD